MKNKRVLWLLNHDTLSKFELPLLVELGFEVFTPKNVDSSIVEWSGSVTYEYDKTLSLNKSIIDRLNTINFYKDDIDKETVNLINEHFDIVLCMFNIEAIKFLVRDFNGKIFIRAFGVDKERTYYQTLEQFLSQGMLSKVNQIKDRIWFSQCYENLSEVEQGLFKDHAVYMPLGLPEDFYRIADTWNGTKDKILFFCSRINVSPYYKTVYEEFKKHFRKFEYSIGGNQPVEVNEPHILGFLGREEVDELFKTYKVMYYHSTEPRHVHYHPLEAMIAGMPVIYMQGGMLDALAESESQPGRAKNMLEARKKVRKILDNDIVFIDEVIQVQRKIIYKFSKQYNLDTWKENFIPLIENEDKCNNKDKLKKPKATKIGVFILDKDKKNVRKYINDLLVIHYAMKQINPNNQVVLGVTPDNYKYLKLELAWVFKKDFSIREVEINEISDDQLKIISNFNYSEGKYLGGPYIIPDDKRKNFIDMDTWLFMGNEYMLPIAPIKPYWIYSNSINMRQLSNVNMVNLKNAEVIFVNNVYDKDLLTGGMGIGEKRIYQLPYTYYTSEEIIEKTRNEEKYLLITCGDISFNCNEYNILEILERKYRYGNLEGRVKILTSKKIAEKLESIIKANNTLAKNIEVIEAIDEFEYINTIRQAESIIVYPTSSSLSMDIITAIQFNKQVYSIMSPTTRYLQAYFNYEIKDYSEILDSKKVIVNIPGREYKVNALDMQTLNDEIKVVLEKIL